MSVAMKTKVDLDQLRSREAELTEQVEAKRAQLSEYPAKIAEANLDAVYAGKRPLAQLNSPLQKLCDAEKKGVTTLVNLEGELSAVRSVIVVEAARVAEEETAVARAQLEQFNVREETFWKRGGELFGELAATWNDYIAVAEESDKCAGENGISVNILAVEPAPLSFKAFLLLLYTAATSEEVRAPAHEQQLSDSGIFGRRDENGNALPGAYYDTRPAGVKTTEVRRRLDERDILFNVVPDLRGVVRALSLSGRVRKFTAE
jgi:hypothetical protein